MSPMITGITLLRTATAGTLVGYLHTYNSGVTVPSSFILRLRARLLVTGVTANHGRRLMSNRYPKGACAR